MIGLDPVEEILTSGSNKIYVFRTDCDIVFAIKNEQYRFNSLSDISDFSKCLNKVIKYLKGRHETMLPSMVTYIRRLRNKVFR